MITAGETSATKTKTTFRIAHPPPRTKHQQRLHIRIKKLLQLQLVSDTARTAPFLDVVPASQHSEISQQRLLPQLKCGRNIGSADLVVLRSNVCEPPSGSSDQPGKTISSAEGRKDVVAVLHYINGSKPGNAEATIEMGSEPIWKPSKLRSGTYEFVSKDKLGRQQIVRWAPKRGSFSEDGPLDARNRTAADIFNFSVLDPTERRHAVIAKLTPESIDIWNQYRKPTPLSPSTDRDTRPGPGCSPNEGGSERAKGRPLETISEELRLFILASGIWVGLNEGFSPYYVPTSRLATNIRPKSFHGPQNDKPAVIASSQNVAPTIEGQQQTPHRITRPSVSSPAVPQTLSRDHVASLPQRSRSDGARPTRKHQHRRFSSFSKARIQPCSVRGAYDGETHQLKGSLAEVDYRPPAKENSGGMARSLRSMIPTAVRKDAKGEGSLSGVFRGWRKAK